MAKMLFLLSSVKTSENFFRICLAFSEKLNFKLAAPLKGKLNFKLAAPLKGKLSF